MFTQHIQPIIYPQPETFKNSMQTFIIAAYSWHK